MTPRKLMRAAAVAASLCAGGVWAQQVLPPVMTDAAPMPAEDRDSTGALVLENSLVRAQQQGAFQRSSQRTGVESVGRGVIRATMRQKTESDLAQAREAESLRLYDQGAGSLQPR